MYSVELLQAINDWQAIGIGKTKKKLAEKILLHSNDLQPKFKSISSKCYRQVALSGMNSVLLGANMELPETYSSWSFDKSVAMNFNGGVPVRGRLGVIFEVENSVPNFEVVLNLYELFKDPDFLEACKNNESKIKSYKTGIGYFLNKESEVILKIDKLTTRQIWAYGGYSASREQLAETLFGHKPNENELKIFDARIKAKKISIGAKWVTGVAKDRTVKFHIENAKRLSKKN